MTTSANNRPTVSAVLIVKNEEALLGKCLDSLKGIDEIIICDTGSKDRTVELAKLYTKHVCQEFTWNDSFCDARNHAKSHATSDWILSIDADEILHDLAPVYETVALAEQKKSLAVDCTMVASDNGQVFYYPRLFKNDPRVFWAGNIHNHLSVVGDDYGNNVKITHYYSPAHDLDPERAFRILKKEVANRPDAIREMFYLGREYFYKREYESAVVLLGKYVQRSSYLPEKAEAFLIMSRAYWYLKMPEDARDAIMQALKINAHFKEAIVFMSVLAGIGSGNKRWEANAKQWEKMAESADNRDVLFIRDTFDFR